MRKLTEALTRHWRPFLRSRASPVEHALASDRCHCACNDKMSDTQRLERIKIGPSWRRARMSGFSRSPTFPGLPRVWPGGAMTAHEGGRQFEFSINRSRDVPNLIAAIAV